MPARSLDVMLLLMIVNLLAMVVLILNVTLMNMFNNVLKVSAYKEWSVSA